jgi:O6-methylguanine-DNA--protein-cysteine methyltransferase
LSGIADQDVHWLYAKQIDHYLQGKGTQLDFPLRLDGTVRRNGSATGYGGGPYIKHKHLTVESRNMTL